jgi:hypothetical protein
MRIDTRSGFHTKLFTSLKHPCRSGQGVNVMCLLVLVRELRGTGSPEIRGERFTAAENKPADAGPIGTLRQLRRIDADISEDASG